MAEPAAPMSRTSGLRAADAAGAEGRRAWRGALALALAVTATALAAPGCRGGTDAVAERPYAQMEQGLRRARERAEAGDAAGARREFFDSAHDPLHRLAAEVVARDRASAARLLEAKQAVERSLDEGSPSLADDLDRLEAAARDALGFVGPTASTAGGRR